jgi:hypothetical protein
MAAAIAVATETTTTDTRAVIVIMRPEIGRRKKNRRGMGIRA